MKKLLNLVLIMALLCSTGLVFTGCGEKEPIEYTVTFMLQEVIRNESWQIGDPIEHKYTLSSFYQKHSDKYLDNSLIVPPNNISSLTYSPLAGYGLNLYRWYMDDNFIYEWDFSKTKLTQDIILYGKLEQDLRIDYYVPFNRTDGTIFHFTTYTKYVIPGMYATPLNIYREPLPSPEYSNAFYNVDYFQFSGWYREPEYVNLYDFNQPLNCNLSLYAKFIAIY